MWKRKILEKLFYFPKFYKFCSNGAIAQLGERSVRNAEVGGSTPLRSNDVKSLNIIAMKKRAAFFGDHHRGGEDD